MVASKRILTREWVIATLVVVIILGLAAPILTYPLGRDQGEFATTARGLLQGQVLYRDVWNPKPPAIFYLYAAVLWGFGDHLFTPRLLDFLFFPCMAATLYYIGYRLEGKSLGLWALGIYGVLYFTEDFWTLTQNDGLASLPMALATATMMKSLPLTKATHSIRWRWLFLSGVCCGLVVWFKYPFFMFVLALLAYYATLYPKRNSGYLRGFVAFVIGSAIVIGLGTGLLLIQGGGSAWLESIWVTTGYTAQGYETLLDNLWHYFGYRWRQWHVVWLLTLLWFPIHFRIPARWSILIWWLVGATVAMIIQGKAYDYHWLPMLAPMTLLAAHTWEGLLTWGSRHVAPGLHNVFVGLTMIMLVGLLGTRTWGMALPYLLGQETRTQYFSKFIGLEFTASESLSMSEYLRDRVVPNDTLFIWGFRPEVYYMSHLRPASRFIFQFPLVASWYPARWQQETVESLWASLPPYVLVVRGDFMPWVTGKDADSNLLLQDYHDLNDWLVYNYDLETEIGNFLVWQRKTND